MMRKLSITVSLLAVVASLAVFAQAKLPAPASAPSTASKAPLLTPDLFSLSFTPGIAIPVLSDAGLYNMGGTGDLSAELRMPFFPMLYAGPDVQYTYSPLRRNGSVS